jgi:hypothetical protein
LTTSIDSKAEAFQANAAAMREQVGALRALIEETAKGGDTPSRDKHVARGKLLCVTASTGSWTLARRFSSCRRSRRTACMASRSPLRESSPASGGSAASNAWSSPTTRR